jgi:hypothetical protein
MSSSLASIATLQKRVEGMLPSLSKAEAQVLGLLTYGILMLDECGITGLSHGLAKIEQVPAERLRQRLREFYCRLRSQARQKTARSGCRALLSRTAARSAAGLGGEKGTGLGVCLRKLPPFFTES